MVTLADLEKPKTLGQLEKEPSLVDLEKEITPRVEAPKIEPIRPPRVEPSKAATGLEFLKTNPVFKLYKGIKSEVVRRKSFEAYEEGLPTMKELEEQEKKPKTFMEKMFVPPASFRNTKEYFRGLDTPGKISHMATDPAFIALMGYGVFRIAKDLPSAIRLSRTLKKPYKVLGLSQKATPQQIKIRYRQLARQYHPDISTLPKEEAAKRFKEIGYAYRELISKKIITEAPVPTEPVALLPVKAPIEMIPLKTEMPIIKQQVTKFIPKPQAGTITSLAEVEQATVSPTKAVNIPTSKQIESALGQLRNMKAKTLQFFDVESPFRQVGAPDTGLAIKTMNSKKVAGEEKALEHIKNLNRFGLNKEAYQDVSLLAERPISTLVDLESIDKRQQAANYVRKTFDDYAVILQQRGVLRKPFPESMIDRLGDDIVDFKSKQNTLVVDKGIKAKKLAEYQDLENSINETQSSIDALKQVKYIHLPVRLWFESEQQFNPEGFRKTLASFRQIKGRKTISLADLVEQGIVPKEKIDVRDIMANYVRYVESKLAEKDIIDSAMREGLAIKTATAPADWIEFPTRYAPSLKGLKVHPAFADYLEEYFRATYRSGADISKILAPIKMMQFYNPVFLPMYDVVQAGMAGTLTQPGLPKHIYKAFQMAKTKNKEYFEAYENGLFSTPYTNPFDEFQKQLGTLKGKINNGSFIMNKLSKLPQYIRQPKKIIGDLYSVSWNVAWAGDKTVRLITYNYLRDKGLSAKDAAQTAALFHGDYASVPAQTRKILNKIFFTPTFKIAMTKLYDRMLKGAIQSTAKLAMGKAPPQKEAIFGRGLFLTAGILYGKDKVMQSLQFEREQFCRKYYRREMTDEGEVEAVLTFANPANMVQRYWYRLAPIFDPRETKKGQRTYNALKYEFHPLYQIAEGLVTNRSESFRPIYNPFDPTARQVLDVSKYITRRIVRMMEFALKDEEVGDKRAKQAIQRSSKKFIYDILSPITFRYIRSIKESRIARRFRSLENEFRRYLIVDPPKNEIEYEQRTRRMVEMINQLEKEIE